MAENGGIEENICFDWGESGCNEFAVVYINGVNFKAENLCTKFVAISCNGYKKYSALVF